MSDERVMVDAGEDASGKAWAQVRLEVLVDGEWRSDPDLHVSVAITDECDEAQATEVARALFRRLIDAHYEARAVLRRYMEVRV